MILHSALSIHTNRDMLSLFITIVLLYNYEKAMDIDNDYVLKWNIFLCLIRTNAALYYLHSWTET